MSAPASHRYANRKGERRPAATVLFDQETPVAGFYRVRLGKGAPPSAVRIWLGFSIDPATGEEVTERSPTWQCAVNGGDRVPFARFWPHCASNPIDQAEHDRLATSSRTMDETSVFFDPSRPVDLHRAPPPF